MFWMFFAATIAAIFLIGFVSMRSRDRALRSAPQGAVRIETLKPAWVNQTVRRYAAFGWRVVEQSSAKSFVSQPRVTITFRKG